MKSTFFTWSIKMTLIIFLSGLINCHNLKKKPDNSTQRLPQSKQQVVQKTLETSISDMIPGLSFSEVTNAIRNIFCKVRILHIERYKSVYYVVIDISELHFAQIVGSQNLSKNSDTELIKKNKDNNRIIFLKEYLPKGFFLDGPPSGKDKSKIRILNLAVEAKSPFPDQNPNKKCGKQHQDNLWDTFS